LSRVWVVADVYESDLPHVRIGSAAQVTINGQTLEGKVAFIAPVVTAPTRTASVRIELENKSGALRPDMYAEVVLQDPSGIVLVIVGVLVAVGVWSVQHIAVDALPDLSDTQVIVFSKWDRSPDVIEDQVTYPIISSLLGAPHVKAIRGFSDFGFSYVYVIFD